MRFFSSEKQIKPFITNSSVLENKDCHQFFCVVKWERGSCAVHCGYIYITGEYTMRHYGIVYFFFFPPARFTAFFAPPFAAFFVEPEEGFIIRPLKVYNTTSVEIKNVLRSTFRLHAFIRIIHYKQRTWCHEI